MYFIQVITFLIAAVFVSAAPTSSPLDFRIISFNVRQDASDPYPHEEPWDTRKVGVIDILDQNSQAFPTLIGVQEVKHHQLVDIISGLNSQTSGSWTYFGVGRDDGQQAGEYAAILYDQNVWKLNHGFSKWLSETPDVPSKGWDAANIRIVSVTEMQHIGSGVNVNYLNTHYDHKGEVARQQSSYLINDIVANLTNDYPSFLSGDFNSLQSDGAYQTLSKFFADTRQIANTKYSQIPTYTGFEPGDNQTVIDFIWAPKAANGPDSSTTVVAYNVLDTWLPQGFRYSDHRPVVVHNQIVN